MAMRNLALWSGACIALAASACAAPDSQAPAATAPHQQPQPQAAASTAMQAMAPGRAPQVATAPDAQAATSAPDPAQAAPMRDLDKLRKLKVRTGGPLPPQVLPKPPGAGRSCRTDADCNGDSSQAAAAASPACATDGDRPCRCVEGTCIALAPALDPPVDPAEQR